MALTVELDGELEKRVRDQSAAWGELPDVFVMAAIRERLQSQERSRKVDEALGKLSQSGAKLERNGRSWHEISHEGHRY